MLISHLFQVSKAVKQLISNHRLILSGTPIQNNVLELWSLFDFLMPGFLGTEKQFQATYGRPILQSRDPKSSVKDQEAGKLFMLLSLNGKPFYRVLRHRPGWETRVVTMRFETWNVKSDISGL